MKWRNTNRSEEEEEEHEEVVDDGVTTNKTDLKWIHDDDEFEDEDGVWQRFRAFINPSLTNN